MSTVALTGNPAIDGILWGVRWDLTSLTYGFATATSEYLGYQVGSIQGFQEFNATQKAAVHDIVKLVNAVIATPITFTSTGANANLRFAEASFVNQDGFGAPGEITTAVGTPPEPIQFPSFAHGDMFFNTTDYNTPKLGNYAYLTLLHELGHALGLKHGHVTQNYPGTFFEINALPAELDSMEFSVMTYRSNIGGPTDFYRNGNASYAQSLMMLDIAALQYLYGADFAFRSGDTTYKWNPSTGEMSVNGASQGRPAGNKIFQTIWDGGGNDSFDLSNYASNLAVDLRPGAHSTFSGAQLAVLNTDSNIKARGNVFNALLFNGDTRSLIENAFGGSGNDRLKGNGADNKLQGNNGNDALSGFGGKDKLYGGPGDDALAGGSGKDTMGGGNGQDRFNFSAITDSPNSSERDIISGFEVAAGTGNSFVDRLDFSALDAKAGTAGNDSFSFVGTALFSGEGQIRVVKSGSAALVLVNTSGNSGAEMSVLLAAFDVNGLTQWDFIL